jgi:phosphate-selective porin OprO/OprP
MKRDIRPAALAFGIMVGACGAASAQDAVQTNQPVTLDQQLRTQARQIETQQTQIETLQDQVEELTAILSNRLDRVEAQTESGRVNAVNPGPRIEGPNARNTFSLIGAVQVTVGGADIERDGPASPTMSGGTEIKRARIGVQGTAFNDFAYQAEFDLAAAGTVASAARDLYVQYNGFRPFSITMGNIKPLIGLETSFSDRSNAQTFIESSLLSSLITAPGTRYIGGRISNGGSHWSAVAGLYGDDVNNNGVALPAEEGFGAHGRFTFAPINSEDSLVHLGVSGFWRDVATGRALASDPIVSQLRVRSQPESTIDAARLIDTGNLNFADTAHLIAVDAALLRGPFSVWAEWARMDISQSSGRPDLDFSGAYVGASWLLTGERRPYDARTGVFTRFTPHDLFDPSADNWGAWELAARWSTLDLNSAENVGVGTTLLGVRGGEETNYTLGLNWYWNAYFRLMLNYVHADAENYTNTFPGPGAIEGAEADLWALRVQQEW